MTQTEHLAKIRAKCVELLAEHENNAAGYVTQKHAVAGWKSTIAAIDFAEAMPGHIWRGSLESLVIAAWPEELL